MGEYNKSYGANDHTSLLSHAQSQSQAGSVSAARARRTNSRYGHLKKLLEPKLTTKTTSDTRPRDRRSTLVDK